MKGLLLAGLLLAVVPARTVIAQTPPPNDNFTNAILLSGNHVSFAGSLTNATLESEEPFTGSEDFRSVWWKWAPATPGPVVLQIWPNYSSVPRINLTLDVFHGSRESFLQDINTTPAYTSAGSYITQFLDLTTNSEDYYYFRVSGDWQGAFNMELTASPLPLILQQPQDCTISPHGSAFFGALATGIPAPTYQWMFNDTPLPDQTAPILMLYNVQTNAAGRYSVVASNSGGTSQSATAWLTVTPTNPVPRVTLLPRASSSDLRFIVQGEGGRWYQFETTDALTNAWLGNYSWYDSLYARATNEYSLFSVPRLNPQHQFLRVSLITTTDGCVAQLRAMRSAINFLTLDNHLGPLSGYTIYDLAPYFPGGTLPICHGGGIYSSGATITNNVTCSAGNIHAGHRQ